MSLGRALLQHSMDSPVNPVTETMRAQVLTALKEAGWRGQPPAEPPAATSSTDEQLWSALLRDDGRAFAELWRRVSGTLFGFSSRQLPPADAEQVPVDAFANLYHQGSAWLEPRATRGRGERLRQRLFRTGRGLVLRRQAQLFSQEIDTATLEALPTKDPDGPLRQLLGRETVEQLAEAAAEACQVLEQEVVAMVADGRPAADAAQALGLSDEHTRALKHRALTKLRTALRAARKRRS